MDEIFPYLPDILKDVTTRVNNTFSTRSVDPFTVRFEYGIYQEVSKNVYKDGFTGPLIWLVMRYDEQRGKSPGYYAEVGNCEIIIAMPTQPDYSMQQRADNIFKPRLLPIYKELMYQFSIEPKLSNPYLDKIEHTKRDRPYWGGGEENNSNSPNLFKQNVEAVHITNLKLTIEHSNTNTLKSNF